MVTVNEAAKKQNGCVFRQTFNNRKSIEDARGTIVNCAVNINVSKARKLNKIISGSAECAKWRTHN